MANGAKKTSGGRRFAMAVVLFLILCGVLLVMTGGSASQTEVTEEEGLEHVKAAYEANVAVERALQEGNIGDAKKQNRKALDELRPVVIESAD